MRRSTLWMFLIALLTAGAAVWMAHKWIQLQAPHPGPVAKEPEITQVVIAKSKIFSGQKIDENQIETVPWPSDRVPEGAFNKKEEVAGKMIAKQTIVPNEPVLKDRIVAEDQLKGSILATVIAPNKRAVSVRVNDVTGVEGFVLPGNQVDVVEAVRGKGSRILLENLKVLAVNQEMDKDKDKDKPTAVKAVTLELAPEQAETLISAATQQEFAIHLALRSPRQDRGQPEKHRRTLTVVRGEKVNIYQVDAYGAQ